MEIIDAHMHYFNIPEFQQAAAGVGHVNSAAHWAQVMEENNIVAAIAMGNAETMPRFGGISPRVPNLAREFQLPYNQPDNIYCCLGLDSDSLTDDNAELTAQEFEYYLKQSRQFVGIKLYMGYNQIYINDRRHWPLFELAEAYDVPIAMHSGTTASGMGILKYAHPLTMDEAASNFPRVRFVICHMGNPWLPDAVTVAAKNDNVFIDLSGIVEGYIREDFYARNHAYLDYLSMWLQYFNQWDKLMYGSDWPIVNIPDYINLWRRLIPEAEQEAFFAGNARCVYKRLSC